MFRFRRPCREGYRREFRHFLSKVCSTLPIKATGAMALLPICDSSFTCEDYNIYWAHPWSPCPLRRAHPGPGPHPLPFETEVNVQWHTDCSTSGRRNICCNRCSQQNRNSLHSCCGRQRSIWLCSWKVFFVWGDAHHFTSDQNDLFGKRCVPVGKVRRFHQKSTCLTQLTSEPCVVQIWPRNTPKIQTQQNPCAPPSGWCFLIFC